MKAEYSRRAIGDLHKVAADSRRTFGVRDSGELQTYIQKAIDQIAQAPASGVAVADRPGVRMIPLVRYPFRIFLSHIVLDGADVNLRMRLNGLYQAAQRGLDSRPLRSRIEQ